MTGHPQSVTLRLQGTARYAEMLTNVAMKHL
jgi:hypothetical protein